MFKTSYIAIVTLIINSIFSINCFSSYVAMPHDVQLPAKGKKIVVLNDGDQKITLERTFRKSKPKQGKPAVETYVVSMDFIKRYQDSR